MKKRLREEHDRAREIDEKTTKFTLSFSIAFSALGALGVLVAKQGSVTGVNDLLTLVFGVSIAYAIIGGLIALGALTTLPKYGYGTDYEVAAMKSKRVKARTLAGQEIMNTVRHLRNEAAYQCLRNGLLCLLLGVLLAGLISNDEASAGATDQSAAERPNIILFLADDMGLGDIGAYDPQSTIPTPAMDRIAAEGLRLTDAHSPASVCTPTRYAILTGRYPFRAGMQDTVLRSAYDPPLLDDRETVADMLQRAGYRTAAFGKWHLGLSWTSPDGDVARPGVETSEFTTRDVDFDHSILDGPLQHGFDRFFGLGSSINHGPYSFVDNDRIAEKPTRMREETRVNGGVFRQGWIAPGWDDAAQGVRVSEQALAFVTLAAASGEPFFVYYAASANHFPHSPPKTLGGHPIRGQGGMDDDNPRRNDMVVENDVILRLLIERLDDPDLDGDSSDSIASESVVIVTSDNGADDGFHAPIRDKKGSIYEGGHRVPLLARWPGRIRPGGVSDATVSLVDIYATLAALADVEPAPDTALDSHSMLPVLLGDASADWSRGAVLQQQNGLDKTFAVRDGPWKLIVEDGRPRELYRLDNDLKEQVDLLGAEPERDGRLLETYLDLRANPMSRRASNGQASRRRHR